MIQFTSVSKQYANGLYGLKDISFTIKEGEMVFILGHSGAGKSTLFNLITGTEKPTQGQIDVLNYPLHQLPKKKLPLLRRQLGVVFQDHQLLNHKTVFENVALPLLVIGMEHHEIQKRVRAALKKVGLTGYENAFPSFLSGGEQQRVGIARAVINRPRVLLADEPTGNLDQNLADNIMDFFSHFHQLGVTVLIATHDIRQVKRLNKTTLTLENGQLVQMK